MIVPMIALQACFRVSPKRVNFSLRRTQTMVIPSPATPNWIAALYHAQLLLGIAEMFQAPLNRRRFRHRGPAGGGAALDKGGGKR